MFQTIPVEPEMSPVEFLWVLIYSHTSAPSGIFCNIFQVRTTLATTGDHVSVVPEIRKFCNILVPRISENNHCILNTKTVLEMKKYFKATLFPSIL